MRIPDGVVAKRDKKTAPLPELNSRPLTTTTPRVATRRRSLVLTASHRLDTFLRTKEERGGDKKPTEYTAPGVPGG